MVEKIDRPELRPLYEVREPKETKENLHHQQQGRKNAEKQYKKQLESGNEEWRKFGRKSITIKPATIECRRIQQITIKSASLHRGAGMAHIDIHWKDGRKTENAILHLGGIEAYLKVRSLPSGSKLPDEFWKHESLLEIGIIQDLGTSGSFPAHDINGAPKTRHNRGGKKGILEKMWIRSLESGEINWAVVVFYLIIIISVAAMVYSRM